METEQNTLEKDNQVLVTNIIWHMPNSSFAAKQLKPLPTMLTLSIPVAIQQLEAENTQKFKDSIETFVFNFLNKTYKIEASSCQIWLSLKENTL